MEMKQEDLKIQDDITEGDADLAATLVLPSDPQWRSSNYFRLVEMKRSGKDKIAEQEAKERRNMAVIYDFDIISRNIPHIQEINKKTLDWTNEELHLAFAELASPNNKQFTNLDEQFRVFELIYEALLFNHIMQCAAEDIQFYCKFPQYQVKKELVGLVMYDFFKRKFQVRKFDKLMTSKHKESLSEFMDICAVVWAMHIHLAAAIARLRIKNSALSLSCMLSNSSYHSISVHDHRIVCGWVNTYKISTCDFESFLSRNLGMKIQRTLPLMDNTFSPDETLPIFYHCCMSNRSILINSPLVEHHLFILQDKTLCRGAFILLKALKHLSLEGSIGITHVVTESTCAYLSAVASSKDCINKVFIFGAGKRATNIREYLKKLSATNVEVFDSELSEIIEKSNNDMFVDMVAVLVCPPNSNNGGVDPVFLSMANDGHIDTLRNIANGQPHTSFLKCQSNSLIAALSQPQVQLLVYVTNSINYEENDGMVQLMVENINKLAATKCFQGMSTADSSCLSDQLDFPKAGNILQVPKCDLFQILPLNDLCLDSSSNCDYILSNDYSFCSVIKRKEITHFDSKYIIEYAEYRGVLGRNKHATMQTKKESKLILAQKSICIEPKKEARTKSKMESNFERISAPTYSASARTSHQKLLCKVCSLRKNLVNDNVVIYSIAKLWWKQLLKYVKRLVYYGHPVRHSKFYRPLILLQRRPRTKKRPLHIKSVYINFSVNNIGSTHV